MTAPAVHREGRALRWLSRRHGAGALALAPVVVTAAAVVATAVVHLYLWGREDGYRAVPTIGPLFLVQGVVGVLLGLVLVGWRRVWLSIAAAGFMAASASGLWLSIHGGLFGYDETWDAPWVMFSFVDALVGLAAAIVAVAMSVRRR